MAALGLLAGVGGEPVAPALPLDLRWTAPKTCPSAAQVEARIREHLGREGIEPDPAAGIAKVQASIALLEDRHELSLTIETAAGVTELQAGDEACDALAELVAIKISLALDPVETARQLLPAPVPPPAEPTKPPEPVVPPPAPAPARARPALHLQVAPLVGGGALPSVEVGGFGGVGVTGRMWQVSAHVESASGPGRTVEPPPNGRVGMVLLLGGVTACVLPTAAGIAFPACLGLDGGAMHGRGIDLATERAGWSPLLAAAVETGLTWPMTGNVRLFVRARARVHALRPSFAVGGIGEVHRAGVVGGRVLVGLEAVFRGRSSRAR